MAFLGFLCTQGTLRVFMIMIVVVGAPVVNFSYPIGNCKGVVVSIGDRTVIGNMIINKKWPPKSPSS